MRRLRLLVLGFLAVAGVAAADAPALPANERPAALRGVGFDQKIGKALPLDARFRDEDGREVRLGDYFGERPVLLVPAYYECPMLCTLVLNGVTRALRALAFDVGDDFTVVTFSFDPRDTPERARSKKETYLAEYRRPGAAAGWHFLTGDEADIRRVAEAIGFRYAFDPEAGQFAHASGVVVTTADGKVARYFFGVEYPPRDLRLALVEASENRLGSVVDQLLLFCFHYDPSVGRYSGVALGAVRAGGALTLAVLGGFLALSLRRDRRKGAA